MTTVWIAYFGYSHGSDHLVGIYSTQEKAEAALGRLDGHWGDYRGVMPAEINSDPESEALDWEDHRGDRQ